MRAKFDLPHVVFAGSYEGCSCGFDLGGDSPEEEAESEDHAVAARESVAELRRYVAENRVLQLYTCWFDDEAEPHSSLATIALDDLAEPARWLVDRRLCCVVHSVPPGGA